jgi:hypothetical protein
MAAAATRGGKGKGPSRQGINPMGSLLNPERVPDLAPKYANKLGKTISSVTVKYGLKGKTVVVETFLDKEGKLLDSSTKAEDLDDVSVVEFQRRLAILNAPGDQERLRSLKRKYELRLNMEFPKPGPGDGAESTIQAWLETIPWERRRALLMSQKDFEKSYPQGFRA